MVERILVETGLEAGELELEITEGAVMVDVVYTVGVLGRLKAMGVQLAMDDFGVGYSSLNYLKRFPIDTMKIDQSFVRDIGIDAGDTAIVTTIMVLAQNLKLKIVAEGVETKE